MRHGVHPFPPKIEQFFSDRDAAAQISKGTMTALRAGLASATDPSFAWILSKSGLPWLKLDFKIPFQKMLNEAMAARHLFIPHRSDPDKKGYVAKGWRALCLHAISPKHSKSYNVYGYKSEDDVPYRWTEMAKLCPVTTNFFRNVYPCQKYYRVRFMLLESGGYIMPHTDRRERLLWEVNFALNNPKGCFFKMKNFGYVPFKPKSAFILDVSNKHSVANFSNEDRYHLIVHGKPLDVPKYRSMIARSYRKFIFP
jgi:hypothetical protein